MLEWNYCTYLDGTNKVYGVLKQQGAAESVIANKAVVPMSPTNIRATKDDVSTKTIGISFTQGSDTVCTTDANKKYSMTTELMCNESLNQKAAFVNSVTMADCVVTINADHKDGCPDVNIDVEQYMGWLAENEWVVGIIYLCLGTLLMVFGLQWFPYVTAGLIAIFIMGLTVSMGYAFGWMDTTGPMIAVLAVGTVLGVLAGCLIRRKIWIMVALLGLVSGFFSGALVFALISSASGWSAAWGWWVISVVMAIVGGVMAYWIGKSFVLFATSFVGAYLFTRSWTLFFPGHWPTESEIMAGNVDTDAIFWVFFGVLIVSFIGSVCVQKKRNCVHDDLDNFDKA